MSERAIPPHCTHPPCRACLGTQRLLLALVYHADDEARRYRAAWYSARRRAASARAVGERLAGVVADSYIDLHSHPRRRR